MVGAWDFIKEKLDKKTFIDKVIEFKKRSIVAEKTLAQVITLHSDFTSFVPDESFKPLHSWLIQTLSKK